MQAVFGELWEAPRANFDIALLRPGQRKNFIGIGGSIEQGALA